MNKPKIGRNVMRSAFKTLYLLSSLFYLNISSAAETYKLDPEHTYVAWSISHFGFSDLSGKFMASGTVTLDQANPNNSHVVANIETARANTGIPELDDILDGKNFFSTTEFPQAKFVSNNVIVTSKTTAKVFGILTIRNVSKPIVLLTRLTTQGIHPFYKTKAVGFTAEATLERSDFGIKGYLPGIPDNVKLHIEAEGQIAANSNQ